SSWFLRESEAAAAVGFCAKAKRQQQLVFARKRSGSSSWFLRESDEVGHEGVKTRRDAFSLRSYTRFACAHSPRLRLTILFLTKYKSTLL
ncbi:hypothetical protein ACQKNC_07555, partial [Lysinibacillus sp. NPDC094177]|uniref:hypothetical protein n=1 Tax=Lysinibacillus sp. NPDC094177 TaxID=3390580 RepID=UPI003D04C6D7